MERIIVFGTGKVFLDMEKNGIFSAYQIVSVFDNNAEKSGLKIKCNDNLILVELPHAIPLEKFDAVIIAIENPDYLFEICEQLKGFGVPLERLQTWTNKQFVPMFHINTDVTISEESRILIDVSSVTLNDAGTGIQRVENCLYRELKSLCGEKLIPVRGYGKQCLTSRQYQMRMENAFFDGFEYPIKFSGSDLLFLPEFSLSGKSAVENISSSNDARMKSYAFVYDIIKLLHPELMINENMQKDRENFEFVCCNVSGIICDSRSVADDVVHYFTNHRMIRESPLSIYYVYLGYDISKSVGTIRDEMKEFVSQGNTLLMIGTVEIRKNHLLMAKAMKRILEMHSNPDIRLLIIGHDGWKNQEFKEFVISEPILRNRILWIKDASDAELQWAYQNTAALVFPSMAEGFGLPIIEASHFGLPLLLNNIPVFHELAGEAAMYFDARDEKMLADRIVEFLGQEKHLDSREVKRHSWKDCAKELYRIFQGKVSPYAVLQ